MLIILLEQIPITFFSFSSYSFFLRGNNNKSANNVAVATFKHYLPQRKTAQAVGNEARGTVLLCKKLTLLK